MSESEIPASPNSSPWQMPAADLQWSEAEEPFSSAFGDIYFSRGDGLAETEYVFLQQTHLEQRWRALDPQQPGVFVIGETGFGTGLNFLCAWQLWRTTAPANWRLHYVSVEKFPLDSATLQRALNACQRPGQWPQFSALGEKLLALYPPRIPGFHLRDVDNNVRLQLLFGDATEQLHALHDSAAPELPNGFHIDAWFLDGFAPAKNPEMWRAPLFEQIGRLSKRGTTFATFTVAGVVKRGLQEAGFAIEKFPGFGSKRQMLRGEFQELPLSNQEAAATASRSSLLFAATVVGMDADTEPIGTSLFSYKGARRVVANDKDERRIVRSIDYWSYAPSLIFSQRPRVIVIGGGIAGTTTARALAQRGCEVKLLEKENTLAHGASGNPQGVLYTKLSPQDGVLNRFALASYLFALEFYRPFIAENSAAGELCGVLQYADNEMQWQQLQTTFANHNEWVQFVDAKRASELANCTVAQPSLWFPRAGWIAPTIICGHLAQHSLIELHTNCAAKTIERADNTWRIECNGVVLDADIVVIANANSAQSFSQTAHLPLKPIRGQITELPSRYLREQPRAVVCHTGYLSPAANGIHIGATFDLHENDLTDIALRAEDHRHNLQALHNALPELLNSAPAAIAAENLQGRVGYRCTTPDYLPIIGAAAAAPAMRQRYAKLAKNAHAHVAETGAYLPGLYVNVGHGSRGLTSTPLCAELLAAHIAGEPRPLPRDLQQALSPARFLLRNLIRGR